jgi:CBS domain containing-hemolysin-like protein
MGYRLFLVFLIIAINAFFAGAEVALVSVRQSRLKQLAEKGNAGAIAALSLLESPQRLLSVTQVGVTLASLFLGWAGEATFFDIILWMFGPLSRPEFDWWLHAIAFGLSFLVMTYAHVVIGEVIPKNIAIDKADQLAVLVAPVLLAFDRISRPFVVSIERSSAWLTRALGFKGDDAGGGHSAEELKFIVRTSRSEGHLEGFEENAIQKLLELQNVYAREVMVPRNDMVSVPVDTNLDELLRITLEHKYSRLPVYEERPEQVIGMVHYKDLMRAWQERKLAGDRRLPQRPFNLRRFLRRPLIVPETKPLNQLIDEFRRNHTHMAIVADEFGTIVGLVTLEDVLEQIFGEIADEHDVRRPLPSANARMIEVDGTIPIRDLATHYQIELPGDAGFETLAGFLLFQLGEIPSVGNTVSYGGRKFTVTGMDRNRIAKVRIEREPAAA